MPPLTHTQMLYQLKVLSLIVTTSPVVLQRCSQMNILNCLAVYILYAELRKIWHLFLFELDHIAIDPFRHSVTDPSIVEKYTE